MDDKEFYTNCQYDIRVYKTKGMENSRHIISGDNKICIVTGVCSFLQSLLDTNILTTKELEDMVRMVKKVRKTGARNRVIYNSEEED